MSNIKIAYFSAEIGLSSDIKTYAGGLGILAGDTIKAMADLEVPFCALTLLYKKGNFKQKINENDLQEELDEEWKPDKFLENTGKSIYVSIDSTPVKINIFQYNYRGISGHIVPIYFLDTHDDENPSWAKELTEHLYVGDRLSQEILLGIGGVRALKALDITNISKFHMNEGHSSFLTLELYKQIGESKGWDDGEVKEKCVFTTHTPIPAGHDTFSYEEVYQKLAGEEKIIPWHIKKLAGEEKLNTTLLALSFSSYVNAVSKKHSQVTCDMFPEFSIDAITNGIHASSWVNPYLDDVYSRYISNWKLDNGQLDQVFKIPSNEIYNAHQKAKNELIAYTNTHNITGCKNLAPDVLTIGFARRFIQYKDAELIFKNMDKLIELGGKVQFIFSGKAHSNDKIGKDIMKRIIEKARLLKDSISIAFLPDYNISTAKMLVSGCDVWLNTPIPYNEASGTSGMKAAVNGCIHFSRLDGWAIESFQRNGGGYPIYEYMDFITTLEYKLIPLFYSKNKKNWVDEMKLSIGNSGSYFNTHRMAKEYLKKAYKLT